MANADFPCMERELGGTRHTKAAVGIHDTHGNSIASGIFFDIDGLIILKT